MRRTFAMLAERHEQIEVADRFGVTPAAVCQRVRKAKREWQNFQEVEPENPAPSAAAAHA